MTEHPPTGDPGRLSPAAAFMALYRWYRPYLSGMRGLITWTVVGLLVYLACAAVTPLLVEWILHHGTWDTRAIVGLVAIVVLQLVVSYYSHIGAHRIAFESASTLRLRIFDRTLASRISRQAVLDRSSIVARHADDVDRIAEAVEKTFAYGLPGVVRVLQSLILLSIIEPIAGIAMTIATVGFLLLHRRIGRALLRADHARTQAYSDVASITDETISTSRLLAGLHLGRWQRERFARRVEHLEHRTHDQGTQVARLVVAAHTAGLIGLVVITIGAVALGGESLAGVAAAVAGM